MEVIKALLSFLGYLYHGLLCLVLLVISGLAMLAGAQTLRLGMLPWTGSTLLFVLIFGTVLGLLIVAITGWIAQRGNSARGRNLRRPAYKERKSGAQPERGSAGAKPGGGRNLLA